jgi:lysozyme
MIPIDDNTGESMRVQNALIRDESLALKPYRDSVGKLTIGVGRNLDDHGISEIEAMIMLDNDIRDATRDVYHTWSWSQSLTEPRQAVMIMLTFNMGVEKLATFTKMLSALRRGDYDAAAQELLDSAYHREVPARSTRLAAQLRSGAWA